MNKKKIKKLLKNKKFVIFSILLIILIICLFLIKGVLFPSNGSNYGNRLDGIKQNQFTSKNKESVIKNISSNEKVSDVKINVHGKIINVIYNVDSDVSIEDAKNVAVASLDNFSDKIKKFYDIQFIITMDKEEGEEIQTTNDKGETETSIVKKFPIMGYKNSSKDSIVW